MDDKKRYFLPIEIKVLDKYGSNSISFKAIKHDEIQISVNHAPNSSDSL